MTDTLTNYQDWTAVATDGDSVLVVRDPSERDSPAALFDLEAQKMTPEQPLQVWFKWGVFEPIDPTPFADLEEKGGPGSGNWGHAGRPGVRGGSAAGTGGRGAKYPDKWPRGSRPTRETDLTKDNLTAHFSDASGTDDWWDKDARAMMKAQVVEELSERSGLDPEITNEIIAEWAITSNDTDMRALSLQEAAAEEFGVELNDWQKSNAADLRQVLINQRERVNRDAQGASFGMSSEGVDLYIKEYVNGGEKLFPITDRASERKFMRAMYSYTQERLASAGFKPEDRINIFRGVTLEGDPEYSTWDLITVKGNPLESWSLDGSTASNFADNAYRGWHGLTLETAVPVKSIVGMATSGFGCLPEGEIIYMGAGQTKAVVVEVYQPFKD